MGGIELICVFFLVGFLYFLLFIHFSKEFKLFDPITLKDSEKLAKLHSKKKNIPTMAGIIFVLPMLFFLKSKLYSETLLVTSYFLIGLLDDILKQKKKNFSIRIRLWLEFIPVFLYLLHKLKKNELSPLLKITSSYEFHISYYSYILLTTFIFVGMVNSFNITDGVDGLLGSLVTQIIIGSLFILSKFNLNFLHVNNVLYSLLGIILAFLILNFPPARIFMGNTGSLTLGAIFANIYILYNLHIIGLIICFTPIVNTISVVIQSFSYRIFGKRVFPIAPLHHALEFKNFSSIQIIFIYFTSNLIAISFLIFLS